MMLLFFHTGPLKAVGPDVMICLLHLFQPPRGYSGTAGLDAMLPALTNAGSDCVGRQPGLTRRKNQIGLF